MNFSQKTLGERWCEQKWQDDLFRFQMEHRLSDKAIQELEHRR